MTQPDNQKETNNIRRRLTLLLQNNFETIEKIRQTFNPKQYELIKTHVTLCREDEIENLDQINQETFPSNITSSKISLIEKRNDDEWKILKNFSLT